MEEIDWAASDQHVFDQDVLSVGYFDKAFSGYEDVLCGVETR